MKRKTKTCVACPDGPRELPMKAFGIDTSKPDKRNANCLECVRRKMRERRAAQRSNRRAPVPRNYHRRLPVQPFVLPDADDAPVSPRIVGLVFGALAGREWSQGQLVDYARARLPAKVLPRIVADQVTMALGELFQRRAIATRGEADTRVYFRREFVRRW